MIFYNGGDALIAYATIGVLNKVAIEYSIGEINKKYENETIFYGGEGNLVGLTKIVRTL